MENKARYTLVGLFVIVFTIAMIAFVLWLARVNVNNKEVKEYRLYVTKSISGLKPKSIVYYKGLDIGTVSAIQINPTNLEEIEIILSLTKPSLVKTDTYAKIESQGVTGNKIIELAGGKQDSQPLQINSEGIYIIPIKKTLLDNLTQNATSITDKADLFLTKLNLLLNESNMQKVSELLENTNTSTQNFNKVANSINQLINDDIKKSLHNIDKLSNDIHLLSNNVNHLLRNDVKTILNEFKDTAKSAQNMDQVIVEFENTLIKINNTIDKFHSDSANMIFQTREIKYGPGEKVEK